MGLAEKCAWITQDQETSRGGDPPKERTGEQDKLAEAVNDKAS